MKLATLTRALLTMANVQNRRTFAHQLRRRLHSDGLQYGLHRDLHQPFEAPSAKIPLTIRPLRRSDLRAVLGMDTEQMSAQGPYMRMQRLDFFDEGIGQCYVAATKEDEPCYMQWLLAAGDNPRIKRYFHGGFPTLALDEALLEYAFTPEAYQGKGIMPAAMARIAEKATDLGARWVITFVDAENVPALKGCQRSGFTPYLLRHDRWRVFRRRVSFEPLPNGTGYPFETNPQPSEAAHNRPS